MSNIKQILMEIELIHLTLHKPNGSFDSLCKFCVEEAGQKFTEEEKVLAAYDHLRADEVNSTEVLESEVED